MSSPPDPLIYVYVTPDEVQKALGLPTLDPRLDSLCVAVSDWIDWNTGHWDSTLDTAVRMEPIPALVHEVALAWAVESYKQPDAAFSLLGMAETGPVRIPREPYRRFIEQLAPVTISYGFA